MIRQYLGRAVAFAKGEVVLTAAIILAVISAFFVPPSPAYVSYIDWNTLALLFDLMAVMKGFQKEGLFEFLGTALLKRIRGTRTMLAVLVFLPFVCSMVITNDVSLITFVPFGIAVLKLSRREPLVVPMVAMQTLAANLGSMLTPMGNPQNLYLYSQSGMSFWELCGTMLPYVALSGICLAVMLFFSASRSVRQLPVKAKLGNTANLVWSAAGFVLCLLGIFDLIPPLAIAAVVFLFLLFKDRQLLKSVDYALLGTFVAFFVFIGNLSAISWFQDLLVSALEGRVTAIAVAASQVISNVPAALLLSGFTQEWNALLIGCNIGGLGTLIASMASLISYKQVAREYPEKKRKYFIWFTVSNLVLLALLLLEYGLLEWLF